MTNTNLLDLKKTGFKLTSPRREVLSALSSSNPVSAQEMAEILKQKGFEVDLVTVYRTLELFESLGMIRKVQFEDKTARFELISGDEHHHHLVCIKCGVVEDVEVNEESLVSKIEDKTNFKIQRHSLEFFGLCKNCR